MNLKTKLELVKVARDLDKAEALVNGTDGLGEVAATIRTASDLLVSLTEDKPATPKATAEPAKATPAPAKAPAPTAGKK